MSGVFWRSLSHATSQCCRNQERACEFTAWFDYITSVLVELSNEEESDTPMKTKDTLLVPGVSVDH